MGISDGTVVWTEVCDALERALDVRGHAGGDGTRPRGFLSLGHG